MAASDCARDKVAFARRTCPVVGRLCADGGSVLQVAPVVPELLISIGARRACRRIAGHFRMSASVAGGKIIAVGNNVATQVGAHTRVIDLQGQERDRRADRFAYAFGRAGRWRA